tara:strand:- start:1264 stop:1506 length:243 start_codon:yes stop_codon:yes gene_type:complete
MSDIFELITNNNLVTQSRVTELANNISNEQKKQLNYQMLYSKLEQAICETKAHFPNSEVTDFLMNRVNEYLAEIQSIIRR